MMKIFNFLTISFVLLLACGCADKDADAPGSIIDGETLYKVDLRLDIGVDPATRSRELNSSECLQSVNNVRVYLFRSDTGAEGSFLLYHPYLINSATGDIEKRPYLYVSDFEKATGAEWNDHILGNESHSLYIQPMLGKGVYRFLAVGRDDLPESSPLKISWTEGVTNWDEALMQNENGHPRVTEIFSGYPRKEGSKEVKSLELPDQIYFHETIILRRAVAGVLLHVTDIPQTLISDYSWYAKDSPTGIIRQDMEKNKEYNVAEVAIVAAGYYPTLDLVNRRWHEPRPFVTDESRFFATRLAWISTKGLEKATSNLGNPVFKGSLPTGNFVFPARLTDRIFYADYTGGEKEDPEYMKPFDKSLYLCFYAITAGGSYYPIKMVPIKIVRSTIHDPIGHDICAGDDEMDPTGFHYNLVANHIYCLGMFNPSDGIDEPVNLDEALRHPELEITVIGAWQTDVNIDMNF